MTNDKTSTVTGNSGVAEVDVRLRSGLCDGVNVAIVVGAGVGGGVEVEDAGGVEVGAGVGETPST